METKFALAYDQFVATVSATNWSYIANLYKLPASGRHDEAKRAHGTYETKHGRRYALLVHDQSAVAFVEYATGDIFKPASWRAPAKHKRGNIYSARNGGEALSDMGSIVYLK